jgi:N-dimethylarginine dimethylaminohydrolase
VNDQTSGAEHEGRAAGPAVGDSGPASPDYFHRLVGPEPEPPFQDPAELEPYWGRRWGAADEVATLRMVLMRRPGPGLAAITADAWNESAQALVDPERRWYWDGRLPPDLGLVREQHDSLVGVLRAEGVEVVFAPDMPSGYVKSMFTRDPLVTVPGGAIIGRLSPRMRRGEEVSISKTVAGLGMPILGTITGTGMLEGGSFVKIRRDLAVYGTSIRCNEEGARQLRHLLEPLGVELVVVPLPGYSIHIDGFLLMLDHDKALVDVQGLPYEFLVRLESWGIELIHVHPDERWSCNSLVLRPGRVLSPAPCPHTAERLGRRGIEVVPLAYEEIQKNGGSIHCSTMELVRDW